MENYVKKMGGKRTLHRILIANNGMAATKAIQSMRQWAYMVLGDERAIEFVALATRDDLNANAEFIRLADTFVEVPSGSNKNNYANVDLIVDIAVSQKVDAVWPGWGHASENPRLPRSLKERGIQFIGPTAPVMAALGDKVSANILAQTAKVPSIPWSGQGIECELNEEGVIPEEIFQRACVSTAEEAAAMAEKIGYPVMIKASEGGGGKGIRASHSPTDLRSNFIQVQNEVPGSPIFMMQLCSGARHLEVQIVGDEYGNAVALNGRDCSTQRRFQKIFEEGPPIIAPREVFRQMELSAQRLTQSIGYIGAGTVEYLFSPKDNTYCFLELNPRLQVEHPVTEGLTGINLPSVQLQVAMGIPLDKIPCVRQFFGREPHNMDDKIDFMKDQYVYPDRHVIAARITAENPDEGFKPTSGKIERVKFQSTNKVWGYFSVGEHGGIHEFADSQFGHLFAHGATREDARKALVLALKELDVRGDIRTTVEYLIKLLETKAFKENTIDTSWLDGIIREKAVTVEVEPQTAALSAAVYRTHRLVQTQTEDFIGALAKGQTTLSSLSAMMKFPMEITFEDVKYAFTARTLGPNHYSLSINSQDIEVRVREQPDKSLLCNIAGDNFRLFGQEEALGLRMKINGATVMLPTVYNPSELRSDVTGKIVRFLQPDRSFVEKGQPYVEVEAMKMIMALKATESGEIRHNLSPGSILAAGDLIASLTLKDPSKVKSIVNFEDRLQSVPSRGALSVEEAAERISLALDGFPHDTVDAVTTYFAGAQLGEIEAFLTTQLGKFVAAEKTVAGMEDEAVVMQAVKDNKDNLAAAVPKLLVYKQLKQRALVVLSLLQQLEFLPKRFPTFSITSQGMSTSLLEALKGLAVLDGPFYGALKLKTQELIEGISIPPFQSRVDALKAQLMDPKSDFSVLSHKIDNTVGADLLLVLMCDAIEAVRKAAMEVYIQREYRAHNIHSLTVEEIPDGTDRVLTARWEFTLQRHNPTVRYGYMSLLPDLTNMETRIGNVVRKAASHLKKTSTFSEPINVLHVGFTHYDNKAAPAHLASMLQSTLIPFNSELAQMDVRMVNFMLLGEPNVNHQKIASYHNFYAETNFQEDPTSRGMRPTIPQLLELNRLTKNHDLTPIPSAARRAYLFLGKEKAGAHGANKNAHHVLFLRSVSIAKDSASPSGAGRIFHMAMDELERALLDPAVGDSLSSRLFVNIIADIQPDLESTLELFRTFMDQMISKNATRLLKLRVDEIEVKMRVHDKNAKAGEDPMVPVRLIASSSTGGWLTREAYREYLNPATGQAEQYCRIIDGQSSGVCVVDPYPTSNVLQKKRASARRVGSTYANDFLGLIEVALINSWQTYFQKTGQEKSYPPANLFTFEELVLPSPGAELVKEKRFPGNNKIGMLAWVTTLKTPQYPEGRQVVFIANDVTVQSGSFSVLEDDFFFKASEYARVRGIPRVFISCNSGARIGLVEELKPKFKVAWKDDANPAQGFDYLFLSEDDYKSLAPGTVDASEVRTASGEVRYKLDAIIGQAHGIGVENLRGSGLIAGETSRAYDETFTLSYVTGRSVGIGAYLNRLGQRIIQMKQGPIILTGFSALNKLLGKDVYTSQDQLGGPQIMVPNGVTHEVVNNDREGMQSVIDWLSYTPKDFTSTAPLLPHTSDPYTRPIDFVPTKTPYDPRHMLAGATLPDGSFISGFFDKDSFKEYLGGWGKSVVAGRARLGGINVGVIAVETRLMEQRIPADPGNPESRESIQPQAGQVWYPDSAYKTAQCINDFNRGENLPLIVFANWRGFSGGTRDMHGEILKYGAMIVDSLRNYKHPVFVYIPPAGELRGGAWVVIDPTINPNKMEMFADEQSRGGILEPPGICEVKFRGQEQVNAMHRLDQQIIDLNEMLSNPVSATEKDRVAAEINSREKALSPLYTQIAHEFADLHDRAGRMKAKGCINEVLQWRNARSFFYWRIQKRQRVDALQEKLIDVSGSELSHATALDMINKVIPAGVQSSDQKTVEWLASPASVEPLEKMLRDVKLDYSKKNVLALLQDLTAEDRAQVLKALAEVK